ncbi:endonuclease/exonuclease/phosphatase family protein [Myceligenerans indicum]|uniref:Endonuclease/exonuclease/phosphatase family protein n=1 Tax=Myceligenerans indicum TaxID=2593663 RepID=A0ABS1LQF7_9MICO|nr:endonuclease/exonuclease/phosphatase family protein [Myceligenerans indicum]MBL0888003.1 endonuclease/exonuclease/phosphatase family protein [Myceligenerans indicum]
MSDHHGSRPVSPQPDPDPRPTPDPARPSPTGSGPVHAGAHVPFDDVVADGPHHVPRPSTDPTSTRRRADAASTRRAGGASTRRRAGTPWTRGLVLLTLQLLLAGALLFHDQLPGAHGLRSLLSTGLPWLGVVALLFLAGALVRRSAIAALAFLLPVAAWGWAFWPRLTDEPVVRDDLTVVQHNVSDENRDFAETVQVLLAAEPDVVVLEEVTPLLAAQYTWEFGDALPYRERRGTVGVWSAHPLRDAAAVDLRPDGVGEDWSRGMRVTVFRAWDDPGVTVYAVHLPSTRLSPTGLDVTARNQSIGLLAQALAADESDAVVVAGDLNASLDDKALDPVTALVSEPRHGFGLTFPARFPMVPIDHVLARGAAVTEVRTLDRTGSDHLPIVAFVDLPWS